MSDDCLITIILAGGRSSRMGQDKALLHSPKFGCSLLEQVKKNLAPLSLSPILISGKQIAGGLQDKYPNRGPLSGIHAALLEASNGINDLVFVPVDMPFLNQSLLRSLVDFGRDNQTCAYFEGSYLPLFIPKETQPLGLVTEQILEKEDWSIREFCRLIGAKSLPIEDDLPLVNVNNPRDWQQFCVM